MQKIQRKNLKAYMDDYSELISRMDDGDKKDLIQQNESLIFQSFEAYECGIANLEHFTSSCLTDETLKTILVNKFESSSTFKEEVRLYFKSRKCPYCGFKSLEENTPVEHFLPKSKFQEYSLLGLNLFLCCRECNSKKGDGWITTTRDTLNPYIDDLYDKEFLKITISIGKRISVRIEINNSCSMTIEEKGLLERHFEKFELIRRISNYVNYDITRIVSVIFESQIEFNKDFDIPTHLKYQYIQEKKSGGKNAILTVVYKYFIDNPEMLTQLLVYHKSTKT